MRTYSTDFDIAEYDFLHTAVWLAEDVVFVILSASLSVLFSLPAGQLLLLPHPLSKFCIDFDVELA